MTLRTISWLACVPMLALAALQPSAGCGSSSTSGGGGAPADPCFDYADYTGMTPATTFRTDVLPIFRRACGLSDSCHGKANPTIPNQPFYGPPAADPPPSEPEIAAILAGMIDVAAQVPSSNGSSVPEPGGLKIVKAGDPKNSFMMAKLDAVPEGSVFCSTYVCSATSACGDSMPQFGPRLAQDEIDTIRRWIAQGAMDN